jgi:hypothetical protein
LVPDVQRHGLLLALLVPIAYTQRHCGSTHEHANFDHDDDHDVSLVPSLFVSLSLSMGTGYFPDARLVRAVRLPTSPNRVQHYLNLTNGLEAGPRLVEHIPPSQIGFLRWQSSQCEASRPDLLLRELPTSMLFHLVQGHCVLVYDFGSRNKKRGVVRTALRCRLCVVGFALSASLVLSPSHSRSLARYPAEGTVDGPGVCQVGAGSGVVWSGGVE